MKIRGAVLLVVLSILAPRSTEADERTFDTHSILLDPSVLVCFVHLVREGNFGFLPQERAAFLVLRPDRSFACVEWPQTHEFQQARWKGIMPPGVVAVAHTHPLSSPFASLDDIHEAQRIGMPIFVLTPTIVSVIHVDGRPETLVDHKPWMLAAARSQ